MNEASPPSTRISSPTSSVEAKVVSYHHILGKMSDSTQEKNDWNRARPTSSTTRSTTRAWQNRAISSGDRRGNKEDRGSRGGSRRAYTDESREGTTERSNSTTSRGENHGSMRELSFDLEQPWQRSLLRELENIERSGDEKHARPRSHKILLGRGQSGDYLVEYDDMDDDTTVLTDASSSLPIRPQTIHRSLSGGRVALFKEDEDDDEYGALSTDSSTDRILAHDPAVYRGVAGVFGEGREARREHGMGLTGYHGGLPIPAGTLSRANALVENRSSSGYFKSARHRHGSVGGGDESASGPEPDFPGPASCMCIGYDNILEFLMIPNEIRGSRQQKRQRTSLAGNMLRSSVGNHRTVLGRVNEEEHPESMNVFRDEYGVGQNPVTF
ncbi:hypothetical protein ACA910_012699 [Epithemia clementina (nom. ined.)]